MSVSHLYVFFGEMSIHVFCPFFDFFVFWMLSLRSSLYILDISPLSVVSFVNIFSHSVSCLFVLLTVSFPVQKLFILMKSQKFIFAFVSFAFGDISWKKLLWPMSERLFPRFSSRILMDSYLTLRSFIHFEFIFVWVTMMVQHSQINQCDRTNQ